MHHTHLKLRQIMNELIPSNPVVKVKFKKPRAKEPRRSLTVDQAKNLFACAANDGTVYGLAVMVALASGARRGEILGLTWQYVDFSSDSIYIAKQLNKYNEIEEPKTETSKRWIRLRGFMADRLFQWHEEQERILARLGIPQTPETPVFNNEIGMFIEPNNFSRWWRNFSVDCGFGRFTKNLHTSVINGKTVTRGEGYEGLKFHELRHTQATFMQKKVSPKAAQHRLGHAQWNVTMNTYAHELEGEELEAAQAIDELLAGNYTLMDRERSSSISMSASDPVPLAPKPVLPKYPNGPKNGAEAEEAIRQFAAKQTGEFTKRQVMEACEISSQKWMATTLVKLQHEGVIKKLGTSKDARYVALH